MATPLNTLQTRNRNENGLVDREPTDSCGVGLIASISNQPARKILDLGLTALANVTHRGAVSADGKTGDGAGISTTIPGALVARWMRDVGIENPPPLVGIGVVFLPRESLQQKHAIALIRNEVESLGLRVLGIRDVPIDETQLGQEAMQSCPAVKQFFVSGRTDDEAQLERELFLARRAIELAPQEREMPGLYVASFSCRTIAYKGMVLSDRLAEFYLDLKAPDYQCTVCIYHQRFSTNTAPQWSLCQPFRMLAHNGEINTIRGNRNWMSAREAAFEHPFWIRHRYRVRRLFSFTDSDSASLDNVLELLTLSGRALVHAMAMMVPPAWENDPRLSDAEKAFFEYHSCFCEPWDGPAAIAACDGRTAAACLDRNGLRPARYKVTNDDILIVGSEVGADRVDDSTVVQRGRLGPGQMIAVDLAKRQLRFDDEIKSALATRQPYQKWLRDHRFSFSPSPSHRFDEGRVDRTALRRRQISAGLTREEAEMGLSKMADDAVEPTFSMGLDTPLAVLSSLPRPITDYFKQRFAQVTNPPIDPIRESQVMSVSTGLGPERNILTETPNHCRVMQLDCPILLPGELDQLKSQLPFRWKSIDCTWERSQGEAGLASAIDFIVDQALMAVEEHASVLILSDRAVSADRVAVPMLLAVGAVHHELCKSSHRMMCSLVCETSTVRDSHQLALLFGYGGTVIDPYLAYETIREMQRDLPSGTAHSPMDRVRRYRTALTTGLLKIMSKMGISVLKSYQGAQIFEAIGIGPEVIKRCFKYSYSSVSGVDFKSLAADCLQQHRAAFETPEPELKLHETGMAKPKRRGERHVISGKVTKSLHRHVRGEDNAKFAEFQNQISPDPPFALRDLLSFRQSSSSPAETPAVEAITEIRKRFTTAAMSLGAISPEAHEAIAIAMNQINGKSNSGEGGEDPSRRFPREDGTLARSKIKQVASGRFGVNADYLLSADEIEIKMAQGAKPGEGGQLPGFKVNGLIAKLRHTDPGVTLISPPPHHDIYSIEDLAQLIYDLKMVNPRARVCVKLVAKTGVGGIAVGVAKAHADTILISGHEGGTGASPLPSIRHAGIPWELGLAETHQALLASGLRDRVVVRVDGGLRTGRDIIHAAILGAEEFNFGTMALLALGCVYVKKCHLNTCPVGIATQDPTYRSKFVGKPENLVRYLNSIAEECRDWLAKLGACSMDAIIGRTELLEPRDCRSSAKIAALDLSPLLFQPIANHRRTSTAEKIARPPQIFPAFDDEIVDRLKDKSHASLEIHRTICNTDRNIGTRLSGFLAGQSESNSGSSTSVNLRLNGSAGQSLGAFLVNGISIDVVGEANDYVGKGMSGGEIVLRPPASANAQDRSNVIAGNTILYGATGGRLFAGGRVAERFCVRNSGASAVVEGCGDHGCEYMTQGTVVVLGSVGNNFGAGMTGGTAFVYDEMETLSIMCNLASVTVATPDPSDVETLRDLIETFFERTKSHRARIILETWSKSRDRFRKVHPRQTKIDCNTAKRESNAKSPIGTQYS